MGVRYTSEELFHFVGLRDPFDHKSNYSTLLKILKDQLLSHPPHSRFDNSRTINWDAKFEAGELLVSQVTCYCDIPYEALGLHVQKYGFFGISFNRRFLVKVGTRPVTYVPIQPNDRFSGWGSPHTITMLRDWLRTRDGFYEHVVAPIEQRVTIRHLDIKPPDAKEAIIAVDDLLTEHFFAFLKVFGADLHDETPENFYMEREWRKLGNLSFWPDEVVSVIVHRDFIGRLASEFPEYAHKIRPAPFDQVGPSIRR
jgi:hypothetical protein